MTSSIDTKCTQCNPRSKEKEMVSKQSFKICWKSRTISVDLPSTLPNLSDLNSVLKQKLSETVLLNVILSTELTIKKNFKIYLMFSLINLYCVENVKILKLL